HIILRGGATPNYDAVSVDRVCGDLGHAGLAPRVMIDCSHANCQKQFERQLDVARDVAGQIAGGDDRVIGVMLESHINPGRQDLVPGQPLASVRSHPAVAAVARGRPRTTRLSTTYYDTPKRDLAAAGVALRLRRAGGRWSQTVKGAGDAAAGLHRRAEFEWPLSAPRLDREKLADTPWRKLFEGNGAYRRVFATEVRRSEQPLAFAVGT